MHVIIIGSGVAAFTAAIYLGRANFEPLIIEGNHPGGLLTTTKMVENFPGFPLPGIDGYDLTERLRQQSLDFGTKIVSGVVTSIQKTNTDIIVRTNTETYNAFVVIVCTGSSPRHLTVPGYERLWGKGITTCAVCDGSLPRYRNTAVVVVGGGDTACEFALHLARTSRVVHLVHRGVELFKASSIMRAKVKANPKIVIHYSTVVQSIDGVDGVESVTLSSSTLTTLPVSGIFVAIGHIPNTSFLKEVLELDSEGYIIVNEKRETNIPGIYAAGDVHDKVYKQVATAVGSGCIAALEAEHYLNEL